MIDKSKLAVYVLQLHQNHRTRTVIASTRNESLAMGMHDHEHAASSIRNDFPVVTGSVQYRIGAFGSENGFRLAPAREEIAGCAQAQGVLIIVEMVLGAVEVVQPFIFIDVSSFVSRCDVMGLAAFRVGQSVL